VVEAAQPAVDDDAGGAAVLRGDLLHRRPGTHLAAERADPRLEGVDQGLVAALEPAHHLAPALVARRPHPAGARPDVGRGQVLVAAVELRVEQRAPELVDDAAAAQAPQPRVQLHLVERLVRLRQLAAGDERREADALERVQEREGQELPRRRHREETAVVVEADLRRAEAPAVAEPELLREAEHAVVGREDDVVEAVGGRAVEVEGADEAAEVGRALEQRHGDARLREPVRGRHAEDAAADDPDAGAHAPTAPSTGALSYAAVRCRSSIRQ
jgi:hypothetical protein